MNPTTEHFVRAAEIAGKIESELKRLNRWTAHALPDEVFVNMGAFGSNTMAFEQWIQFILLPRIHGIIEEQGQFPDGSMLGTYAMRVFDGDHDAQLLHNLLYDLDRLVNEVNEPQEIVEELPADEAQPSHGDVIRLGDEKLPQVVYSLMDLLHEFEGDDLESQLQTFDTFLSICSPNVRPEMSDLLLKAADRTPNEVARKRIEMAAKSVLQGGRAAAEYNHDEAMRKYREDFKQDFPELD